MRSHDAQYLYVLINNRFLREGRTHKETYIGYTSRHPTLRIKQHNGEVPGGARYTSGEKWTLGFYVHVRSKVVGVDCPAQSLESHMKQVIVRGENNPIKRKARCLLRTLLDVDKFSGLLCDIHWKVKKNSLLEELVGKSEWPSTCRHFSHTGERVHNHSSLEDKQQQSSQKQEDDHSSHLWVCPF